MMGNTHEITQDVTAEQLRKLQGVNLRTWQARWKSRIGTPYDKNAIITIDQEVRMRGETKSRIAGTVKIEIPKSSPIHKEGIAWDPVFQNVSDRIVPEQAKKQKFTPEVLFNIICVCGVIAHAILVWFDCASLWGAPGFIGGAVAFLVICAAVLLSQTNRNRTAKTALAFAICVDVLAVFVHYPTFVKHGDIDNVTSACFAAFLCACSAGLLYLYHDEKVD